MTGGEAMRLKAGDRLLTRITSRWEEVIFLKWADRRRYGEWLLAWVCRPRPNGRENADPRVWLRLTGDLRLPSGADPVAANVYADFLEEHGEARAAAKLRRAFPCGPVPAAAEVPG